MNTENPNQASHTESDFQILENTQVLKQENSEVLCDYLEGSLPNNLANFGSSQIEKARLKSTQYQIQQLKKKFAAKDEVYILDDSARERQNKPKQNSVP